MKSLFYLCAFALIGLAVGETNLYPRGCIYIVGRCARECEEGTYGYSLGCGFKTPEATCENPTPVQDRSRRICDYSACYCAPPTVRNTKTKKCVQLDECPADD
ncbi:uncharacterized protein LOC131846449 [Achroia grisella]|uniref:uncharacterized protein LOC131846449 n=1 Tax=Achroia grisella TaxID=688607 RepID=UPI0027D277F7|nr:uncharacterized protein LOC131846449 [Achroia grisella]